MCLTLKTPSLISHSVIFEETREEMTLFLHLGVVFSRESVWPRQALWSSRPRDETILHQISHLQGKTITHTNMFHFTYILHLFFWSIDTLTLLLRGSNHSDHLFCLCLTRSVRVANLPVKAWKHFQVLHFTWWGNYKCPMRLHHLLAVILHYCPLITSTQLY